MTILLTIAAAAVAVASPLSAEPLSPRPVSEAATQEGVPAPKAREQRVCLVDTVTGSHIPRKACHTRSEWRDLNVDLPANL